MYIDDDDDYLRSFSTSESESAEGVSADLN
jgi:hypothetical protein